MSNWRFYQDTGLTGGTGHTSHRVMYVDSHNGDDANDGSNIAPLKTIQRALDIGNTSGCDIVLAGYFTEGDFVNTRIVGALIPEGNVIIDGSSNTSFRITNGGAREFYGASYVNGFENPRRYGTLTFQNFTGVVNGYSSYLDSCIFINCPRLNEGTYLTVTKCLFKNCILGGTTYFEPGVGSVFQHNTVINTNIRWRGQYANNCNIQSNIFDSTTILDFTQVATGTPNIFDYNHIVGTLTNKIKVASGNYDNVEAFKVDNPTKEVNGIPSTAATDWNQYNTEDYTLQESSVLVKAGHDKKSIGAFEPSIPINPNDGSYFDYVNIDVSVSGSVSLLSGTTGTTTTKTLYHHEIAPKKRVILKTNAPNLEQNFGLGETMGNLSSDNIPFKTDLEIQYDSTSTSLTNGVDSGSYNGTWLRVPIGEQPLHDTVNNVGNDDPLFDISNAIPISAKYIKMRITLRSNETAV